MKHSFCLVVFALCAALHTSQGQEVPESPPPPAPPKMDAIVSYDFLRPLNRVERRADPQMPPMPQMPKMPDMPPMPPMPPMPQAEGLNRKRRSAKGGGSMPTRKG